ncbi:MAG: hypothetical protein JSR99_02730 [Proteobacteria bacterium]|nr:hypothetical protein [Pseudomonadota bacterium]
MSSASPTEITEDEFLEAVAALRVFDPALSPIGAAILAALHFDIANDSRTFSLKIGVEHALTLREITALSDGNLKLLHIVRRSERSQRTVLALSEKGEDLTSRAFVQK